MNGDGFVDLVITDYERPARIWLNVGKGSFIASGIRLGAESGSSNVLVRDLDGDGDADVFLPNRRTGRHEVWFNRLKEKEGSLAMAGESRKIRLIFGLNPFDVIQPRPPYARMERGVECSRSTMPRRPC